ncbi:unnamed protein product, partial [Symbiodinium pilosum]
AVAPSSSQPFSLDPMPSRQQHDSLLKAAQCLVAPSSPPDVSAISERLAAQNLQLEAEMQELQRVIEAQQLNSGGPDLWQPLAGVVHESRSKLRSSMQQQLQSSQEALQDLRKGILEADASLREERRKRRDCARQLREREGKKR